MTKQELLRKLDALLDEFARARVWGSVEIQFSDGLPNLIRKTTTEKVNGTQESTRVERPFKQH